MLAEKYLREQLLKVFADVDSAKTQIQQASSIDKLDAILKERIVDSFRLVISLDLYFKQDRLPNQPSALIINVHEALTAIGLMNDKLQQMIDNPPQVSEVK